jgi:hypothetical protein
MNLGNIPNLRPGSLVELPTRFFALFKVLRATNKTDMEGMRIFEGWIASKKIGTWWRPCVIMHDEQVIGMVGLSELGKDRISNLPDEFKALVFEEVHA